jgi:hypothetical protein
MPRTTISCAGALLALAIAFADPGSASETPTSDAAAMSRFLDRLMMAESGGRDTAANPLSTAVGAFQFIAPTWLEVTQRHFPTDVAGKSAAQILAMRTERAFARRAAEAYTRDNAAALTAAGYPATWPNLRLAFLLGPGGAQKVLAALPAAKLSDLMSRPVIAANPWMARLTVADLVQRAARDAGFDADDPSVATPGTTVAAAKPKRPAIPLRCDLARASCRRWLALAERRLLGRPATAIKVARRR